MPKINKDPLWFAHQKTIEAALEKECEQYGLRRLCAAFAALELIKTRGQSPRPNRKKANDE